MKSAVKGKEDVCSPILYKLREM
uniref:Uncharacterized protein n=1 Tax=Anguilla anguilla TaxID=7936 RepID=A0A0E9U9Y1_ANGAN